MTHKKPTLCVSVACQRTHNLFPPITLRQAIELTAKCKYAWSANVMQTELITARLQSCDLDSNFYFPLSQKIITKAQCKLKSASVVSIRRAQKRNCDSHSPKFIQETMCDLHLRQHTKESRTTAEYFKRFLYDKFEKISRYLARLISDNNRERMQSKKLAQSDRVVEGTKAVRGVWLCCYQKVIPLVIPVKCAGDNSGQRLQNVSGDFFVIFMRIYGDQ